MAMQVCMGAMLKCSFGNAPSSLSVLPTNQVYTPLMPAANIMDYAPLVNIMPFGMCSSLANPTVAAATVANLTLTKRVGSAFELVGSVRNLFDAQYADPASDEHAVDAIQQNGRTARIGIRWKFWTP